MIIPQIKALYNAAALALRPPPAIDLAAWSRDNVKLSKEDSSTQGEFHAWPFQREPLEVMSPSHPCEKVSMKCASQTMKTRLMLNFLGFVIDVDPGPVLFVEPTADDAENLSKDRVDPMLRDMPCLRNKVVEAKSRDAGNTISHKKFPGGHVTFAFATAPSKLAMRPIRYLCLDEISRYVRSSGKEGDPVRLAEKRTVTFWNRKILYASSPGNEGDCRISEVHSFSDQREWEVPCPFCGYFQTLEWNGIKWSQHGKPIVCKVKNAKGIYEDASIVLTKKQPHYQCSVCQCLISEDYKFEMNEGGRWRVTNAEGEYPGFRINQLVSPVRTWEDIVQEWIECQGKPEQLRVFVNTVLAETWKEAGEEAPDEEKLRLRAQLVASPHPLPASVLVVTAGIDVQADRLEVQVRGWGRGKQSWLIEYHIIVGKPTEAHVWEQLDAFLATSYEHSAGLNVNIGRVAIDSGYSAQEVYAWARKQKPGWCIVTKGYDTGVALLGQPKVADVLQNGKKQRRGVRIWPVNVSMMKAELYGWLKQVPKADGKYPDGYLHDYDAGEEYFAQLCAEFFQYRMVKGYRKGEWVKRRERNEALDTFGECRAAAEHMGISRWTSADWSALEEMANMQPTAFVPPTAPVAAVSAPPSIPEAAPPQRQGQRTNPFTGRPVGGWL